MKLTRLKIRNLYGITEFRSDDRSVILTGDNGTGKSSVIHAIKYALTNQFDREKVIRQGASEGEVLIETDTGLFINRKKRDEQADYKSVKQGGRDVPAPEAFLKTLFTPLQINPVEFTRMSKAEQNRAILELIDFKWDMAWIKEQFGEIPDWPDYSQHILVVLEQIQAENGRYFERRQDLNREIRFQRESVARLVEKIPDKYNAEKWEAYDTGAKYQQLESIRAANRVIEDARAVKEAFEGRKRALEAQRTLEADKVEKAVQNDRETLTNTIERLKAELAAAQDKLEGLEITRADKMKVVEAQHQERTARLDAQFQNAATDADKEITDTAELAQEVETAERMKRFLNEYNTMLRMDKEIENLTEQSRALTYKIEHARALPGIILQNANIPVEGLTVENGAPLIRGLPISNLSEGEQLDLCVDVTLSKPGGLQIILLDGIEKLSTHNKDRLFAKCKEHGIQFIAAYTTDETEMDVHYL